MQLDRDVQEFAGRHAIRELGTIQQIGSLRQSMDPRRLTYAALIADNGIASGARA